MRKSVGNWKADNSVCSCEGCESGFTFWRRRHHCRVCGGIYCWKCSKYKSLVREVAKTPVRVCGGCKSDKLHRRSPQYSYSGETSTNEGTPGPRLCEHSPAGSENNDSAFRSLKSSCLVPLRLSSNSFKTPSSPGPVITRNFTVIPITVNGSMPPTMVSSSASQRQKIITACNQQAQQADHISPNKSAAIDDGNAS